MYNRLIVSILIVFVVTHVQNGSKVNARDPPMVTSDQYALADSIYIKELWGDLWFAKVADGKNWEDVQNRLLNRRARPGVPKKVQMIPVMMGCNYGLLINWFLSLALAVIEECNTVLTMEIRGSTGNYCWNLLSDCLLRGSYAMLDLMRALTYVHPHVKDPADLELFYNNVLTIYSFLTQRSVVEISAKGTNYIESLNDLIHSLHLFLIEKCKPEYKRLVLQEVENERRTQDPARYSYDFYIRKMDSYIEYVTGQLTKLGFRYDAVTGKPDFKPKHYFT